MPCRCDGYEISVKRAEHAADVERARAAVQSAESSLKYIEDQDKAAANHRKAELIRAQNSVSAARQILAAIKDLTDDEILG